MNMTKTLTMNMTKTKIMTKTMTKTKIKTKTKPEQVCTVAMSGLTTLQGPLDRMLSCR